MLFNLNKNLVILLLTIVTIICFSLIYTYLIIKYIDSKCETKKENKATIKDNLKNTIDPEPVENAPLGRELELIGSHSKSDNNNIIDRSLRYDDPKNILNISPIENFMDDKITVPLSSRDPLI